MSNNKIITKEVIDYETLFNQIPDKVKYSSVEKFFRNASEPFNNVEITRRIFTSYIQNGILPEIAPENRLNDKFILYTRDQIIYFYLAQQLKPLTKLDNISKFFSILRNDEIGFSTQEVYEFFNLGIDSSEEVEIALIDNIKNLMYESEDHENMEISDFEKEFEESKKFFMPLIWLAIAKYSIDIFNKHMKNFDEKDIIK